MFPDYRNPLPCVATSADGCRRKGEPDAFKADDGCVLKVDMSQVSQSVKQAMQRNLGAKLAGFPGDQPNQLTARFIEQDNPGRASTAPAATTVSDNIAPLIPQFIGAKEFQDLQAALPNSPARHSSSSRSSIRGSSSAPRRRRSGATG